MQSFSAGSPEAIDAAVDACHDHYPMSLNPSDLATVLRALSYYHDFANEEADADNAHGLYAGILETLGIDVI